MTGPGGRRERKKAQTRQALADAALELFLARGYDQVGVKDVAEAADVAVTTLFKHFPSKEALVFDRDEDIEAGLVTAVRDRTPGESVPAALRRHVLERPSHAGDPGFAAFRGLIEDNPALRDYAHRMWTRHETVLARVIADEVGAGLDDVVCAALARFALDAHALTQRYPDPRRATEEVFAFLEGGWAGAYPGR